MYKYLASLVVLFSISLPSFAADDHPSGTNCELQSPPATAGEEMSHGATFKIFPRARDINASYTGCQFMWATMQGQVVLVSVSAIEKGYVTRLWSPSSKVNDPAECRYKEGKLVRGSERSCPAPKFLLIKSMPAGCVERSMAAGGLAEGCVHE